MNRLLPALLLMSACAVAHATAIKSYATQLDVAADGSARAKVNVQLIASQAGRFQLPTGFGALNDFQAQQAPAGVLLKPVTGKDKAVVEIELPTGVAEAVQLSFTFSTPDVLGRPKAVPGQRSKSPADTQFLRHAFVNTQAMTIGIYQVEVRLPDGVRVHKIGEQLPKPKNTEVLPRVRLDRYEGYQGALLQYSNIKQGDRTSMVLDVVEDSLSYGWLLVGLALSVGYLVGFRDLVAPARA
ncbi:MAG: hypothetical protein NTV11_13410 [Rhodocyclales bacterium]|nr:hypothetical protein [Rhodocyclales bacterium]